MLVLTPLLVSLVAASQSLAGIRIMLPDPVAVSGTGLTLATEFVGNDEIVVTVKPTNPEAAHFGFAVGFNPAEYEVAGTQNASVYSIENSMVSVANSRVFSASGQVEDVSIVLRKTGLAWGELEPQGLEVFTRSRERLIYDPAPAFTPSPTALPLELALFQNYPNPFNPATEIRFSLASEGPVELAIYNMVGQKVVRTLASGPLAAGEHSVKWDATDDTGQPVSAGMYFYQLNSDGQTAVRKMVLAK